jgi:hypothetical protein
MDNRQHTRKPTRSEKLIEKLTALVKGPNAYQQRIAAALPPTYFQGFDDDDVAAQKRIAKRRAKNKVARASRKANRR